jgi:hypothetical protein
MPENTGKYQKISENKKIEKRANVINSNYDYYNHEPKIYSKI